MEIRYLLLLILAKASFSQDSRCKSRDFGNGGTVCVCDEDYCDILPSIQKLDSQYYQIYTSSKSGLRFHRTEGTFKPTNPDLSSPTPDSERDPFQKLTDFLKDGFASIMGFKKQQNPIKPNQPDLFSSNPILENNNPLQKFTETINDLFGFKKKQRFKRGAPDLFPFLSSSNNGNPLEKILGSIKEGFGVEKKQDPFNLFSLMNNLNHNNNNNKQFEKVIDSIKNGFGLSANKNPLKTKAPDMFSVLTTLKSVNSFRSFGDSLLTLINMLVNKNSVAKFIDNLRDSLGLNKIPDVFKTIADFFSLVTLNNLKSFQNFLDWVSTGLSLLLFITKSDNKSFKIFADPVKNALAFISHIEHLQDNESFKKFLDFIQEHLKFEAQFSLKTTVNTNKTYQKIMGFGGAFTDSFGLNMRTLNTSLQTEIIRSYFSKDGLGYNIGRIPMAGSDFSDRPYSYCDTETEDRNLTKFNLTNEDYDYKIPYILQAQSLTLDPLLLFAVPWIAPMWMKTNGNYVGGAIKEDMYDIWTNYYLKFLEAYKKENITVWGISTGNEPSLPLLGSNIPAIGWLPEQVIKWIAESLGPAIRNSTYNDTKIMLLDDNRFLIPWYVESVFNNEAAKNFVDIIAIHGYLDWITPVQILDSINDKHPDKLIMATEVSIGATMRGNEPPILLGSWRRAELYASNIIETLNHHGISWTDWNLALDTTGGPSYIENFLDSPIIINATSGEFYKEPMYYAVGHFSKFIPRDSVRINLHEVTNLIDMIGFLRPDDVIVLVFLNKFDLPIEMNVEDTTRGTITLTLEPHSVNTIIY